MRQRPYSAYEMAQVYVGIAEVSGRVANPQILAMLTTDSKWPEDDSVPWCSAFVNYVAKAMKLPRSKSLRARSWLGVGEPVFLDRAEPGFDVVIFKRGIGPQPGPEVLTAPGHVGFYAGRESDYILTLGGNQSDTVSISRYSIERLLGIRRLA